MDDARGAREKNLTFPRIIRVQPCIRPLNAAVVAWRPAANPALARRTPARGNSELGINVNRDGPEPLGGRSAVPVLIKTPHVPAVIDDDVVEPILISMRRR